MFAQDKWTLDRLTLNLGARFDYLNINFPEQRLGPGVLVPNRNITFPENDYLGWKDVSPRLGAVYDLFGDGKTALKFNLGRYVLAQRLTSNYTDLGNPVNAMANSVTRSWNDRAGLGINGDYIPQCDLLNPRRTGSAGVISDARFGQPIPSTVSDPAMLHGWGKRPDQWEFETSVQHQLMPRVGVEVGYFRRWYGNFTVTDNTLTGVVRLHAVQHPRAGRSRAARRRRVHGRGALQPQPGQSGSGQQLLHPGQRLRGLHRALERRGRQLEPAAGAGTMLQGGISTGRTSLDVCELRAKLPELTVGAPYVGRPDVARLQRRRQIPDPGEVPRHLCGAEGGRPDRGHLPGPAGARTSWRTTSRRTP